MAALSRLPGALRSLVVSNLPSRSAPAFSSTAGPAANEVTTHEPLRILFCGSDAFSIESLRALHAAQQHDPCFIDAIHVVHRPAKPTGRGLKTLREGTADAQPPTVPLAPFAQSLSLPTHPLNTFTSWTPPFAYNLVIAVSFGLLIPSRILSLAPHGGLNVHPSLLPDLRGSAPIPHAILKQRHFTGVSVQTLHPTTFDAGVVLRQSEAPGVSIGEHETRAQLEARLAPLGAEMLLSVLRDRAYVAPVEDNGWWAGEPEAAPKLSKQHHEVRFATMSLQRVRAAVRALQHVWCTLPNGERLVVHGVAAAPDAPAHSPLWHDDATGELRFRAACGTVGVITSSTYPGGKPGRGNAKVAKVLKERAAL
ncbi:Methionyl-tRNA formyltransferase, mitochondrial [Stagonosporopsis vannaccii]|nr:Methionyl-tRNA formyltransferase, mitochondrial [Stagonosporopsis vannaccii]